MSLPMPSTLDVSVRQLPATRIVLFVLTLLVWPHAAAQDQDFLPPDRPPAAARNEGDDKYPFRINAYKSPQRTRFVAVNSSAAAITVSFGLDGSNFDSDKMLPVTFVVNPYSSYDIAQITPATRWEPLRFSLRYSFQPGDAFMPPDGYARYLLPFSKGEPFLVVQSPTSKPGTGTLITHNNDHSRYAFDFGVAEGTLVTAARDGVVVDIVDTFTVGRPDPSLSGKANFVGIMHADRSVAYYVHLSPRGVLVKPGQQVLAGEAIAYSGNTGYSHGPHLHFDVRRAAISDRGEVVQLSVPVDFYRRDGAGERVPLVDGMLIKAP
ncbi:MAG: M23 family metallopeptidase [Betaproteobacteria bacterium]|nr:M23 family metallopeptidase [Betaproteobacteria bacterium]MCL2161806.1 M23 family metallopeptidase [Betaproteobacteria bacterium]